MHGGVLNAKDSSDLILAALGLLNVKMALIACFAMLMFVLFLITFMYNKCNTKKFVSWKGSTTFNIWALIYETIETSTVDKLLKFLCSASESSSNDEPQIRDRYHSRCPNSGSASLAFSTDSRHHPAYPVQEMSPVLTSSMHTGTSREATKQLKPVPQGRRPPEMTQGTCDELSYAAPTETMETTFVNQYYFHFKAILLYHCNVL